MYVDKNHLPTSEKERERYERHQNSIHNNGYVTFLNTAIEATLPFLQEGMAGLDFGCGPNPVLSKLLQMRGLSCDDYDPYFFPHKPNRTFDVIFATECLEHFHSPCVDISYISSLLAKNGILTIMTSLWEEEMPLKDWFYLRDQTHVSIYHNNTMVYLARTFNLEIVYTDQKRIILFRKI